jgi:hypothetical protein
MTSKVETAAQAKVTNPLTVIGLFLSLTDAVAGAALGGAVVTHAGPVIEGILAVFVVGFPIGIAVAFFRTLWKRPHVFYPPSEYAQLDPVRFAQAMQLPAILSAALEQLPGGSAEQAPAGATTQSTTEAVAQQTQTFEAKLAEVQWSYFYEITYRLSFGSQIVLLMTIQLRPQGVGLSDITPFFDLYRSRAAPAVLPSMMIPDIEGYLSFLINQRLVDRVDDTYRITDVGRAFLAYLIRWAIPLDKPL